MLGRSLFVRAPPTDVNELVVRLRRSLGEQAIALGLDVGGRIPGGLPDEKSSGLPGASFLELVQPVRRRERRRRHGGAPSPPGFRPRPPWPGPPPGGGRPPAARAGPRAPPRPPPP